jgi:hypothetical protein
MRAERGSVKVQLVTGSPESVYLVFVEGDFADLGFGQLVGKTGGSGFRNDNLGISDVGVKELEVVGFEGAFFTFVEEFTRKEEIG